MQALNLPTYNFRIKCTKNKYVIFDIIRKKYMVLTPEEWVRQHIIHFLIEEKKYPISLISVEKKLTINNLTKRTDILVFNKVGLIEIIVECKAPTVSINQDTFDQIARYNLKLKSNYLFVTNGLTHFYCSMDFKNEQYVFLDNIPNYNF
ncbi:type I restriction enzyme HsdR N-terminal domain-containing protein [Lutibacter sp.]|uniref:type I restriction enzyme HsdR N-terminal domain-containing protein n=1 Tax=Lutibacter sp. TaxID=1925666 RepID=UPI0027366D33|nr:type I restriction enzyme HsdR N-terminal domain-containing protein [Lutibacter sp.]MDP3313523.1 type I restriction enzyme HsdR N-terminal domain-containing protein [Lutibacter sp.]